MKDNARGGVVSHHRRLKQQTNQLLAGLGGSPDEVAVTLEAAGVHGVPKSNQSCAIALYLTALMGSDCGVRSVAIGPCSLVMEIISPPDGRPAGRLLVQLPKPVRRFVAAFDAQEYPMLTRQHGGDTPPPAIPDETPDVSPATAGLRPDSDRGLRGATQAELAVRPGVPA
jgi:hypothetical protein